jgi:hypothetical protein
MYLITVQVKKLTCGEEGVSSRKLPHGDQELGNATSEDEHTNEHVGYCHTTGTEVVQCHEEHRSGEREHTTEKIDLSVSG